MDISRLRSHPLTAVAAAWAFGVVAVSPAWAAEATDVQESVPPVLASKLAAEPLEPAKVEPQGSDARIDIREASEAPLRWSMSSEYSGNSYRWSAVRGGVDVGMRFEMAGPNGGRAIEPVVDVPAAALSSLPAVSLGLRRSGPGPAASSLLARSLGTTPDNYTSKVGIEWKPAESKVNFLREGLGIRLDGNDRMTVRLRKGVLGIYMQRRF